MIKEGTKKANDLQEAFWLVLVVIEEMYNIEYKTLPHDIARRLLNEVEGFEPMKE